MMCSQAAISEKKSDTRIQRLRDPVHGLITFAGDSPRDQLAWSLINTPEFQRLRRIRQLGVSEFVFPSATHTRFAHSIGVFHVARQLIDVIRRELKRDKVTPEEGRIDVAAIAALLHDLGHGPFSHTFESVQHSRGQRKKHEKWSAEIILNQNGHIRPLLDEYEKDQNRPEFAQKVAKLVEAEDPEDLYHAIVSSSFDADRLDYLRRDRLMTGTGAGAIDFDWLMEHVRIGEVSIEAADAEAVDPIKVQTFCLDRKALPAAEQFLLARYTLHEQVYFHKATRCAEKMIGKLLRAIAKAANHPKMAPSKTGLAKGHPFLTFFGPKGELVSNYLALDDALFIGSLPELRNAKNQEIADLAGRLIERRLYKTLDLAKEKGADEGKQTSFARLIEKKFEKELESEAVIKDDDAKISIYTHIGGDEDRTHKKLHILDPKDPKEITEISELVKALSKPRIFRRYYFVNDADRELAISNRKPKS